MFFFLIINYFPKFATENGALSTNKFGFLSAKIVNRISIMITKSVKKW